MHQKEGRFIRSLGHILIVGVLTILTQIGGILWIFNFGFYSRRKPGTPLWRRFLSYLILYLGVTVFVVPSVAKVCGRVALPVFNSEVLAPHNLVTPLLNRHYVKPKLSTQLEDIASKLNTHNSALQVSYLDANFPFIDGFPLLPHLSHNDGRKVDLSFYYTEEGERGNRKPSDTGYGKFVEPYDSEFNQSDACLLQGYWQYDFTKYLSFGGRDALYLILLQRDIL